MSNLHFIQQTEKPYLAEKSQSCLRVSSRRQPQFKLLKLTIALATVFSGNAYAAIIPCNNTDGEIQCGYGTDIGTSTNAIALGKNSRVTGQQGITIGSVSNSIIAMKDSSRTIAAEQAIAIGANASAIGFSSVSIGGDDVDSIVDPTHQLAWNEVGLDADGNDTTAALNNSDVARAYHANTGKWLVRNDNLDTRFIDTETGEGAVALGVMSLATGTLGTAVGVKSEATGLYSGALGVGALSTKQNSMALGTAAETKSDATKVDKSIIAGVTYDGFAGYEGITAGDQLSVGSLGYKRQIKNVAPGAITEDSTDAINGSQLFAVLSGFAPTINAENSDTQVVASNGSIVVPVNHTVAMEGGKNIESAVKGNTIQLSTATDVDFNSVNINNTLQVAPQANIDMGDNQIHNVAAGTAATDAVTVSQLDKADKNSRAGIAGSAAMGMLVHPLESGEGYLSVGAVGYRGEGALAIGLSASSDNNQWIVKGALSIDTQSNGMFALSLNYNTW